MSPRSRTLRVAAAAVGFAFASALLGIGQPAQAAAVKGKVICTEREPAEAPTHFRFENAGSAPEVIIDVDYATPQAIPKWEAGRTYLMTIDDNTEQVPQAGPAMHATRAECTVESKGAFKLSASEGEVTTNLYVSWATDPVPATAPWSKASKYTIRINDVGGKTAPQPAGNDATSTSLTPSD